MLKSRLIGPVLLVLLLSGFALGVVNLFQLRFNAGDIYPPYSSLRADPLGVKVLYESLQAVPTLSVRRFYQTSAKLEGGPRRVLLILGVDGSSLEEMSEEDFKALQNFMFRGGRVVVSLLPAPTREGDEDQASAPPAAHKTSPNTDTNASFKMVSFLDKQGLRLTNDDLFIPDAAASRAVLAETSPSTGKLPPSISWHSGAFFANFEAPWRTLYQRRRHPVVIERPYGPGSLVLAADSYVVSNEALRRERYPALLTWLLGGRGEILFDETHLGVKEQPGTAALMRRYHLEGVLIGLLLVAGLFVWQNTASFVPPFREEQVEGQAALVEGKESTAGFASLLRRSIPASDLVSVCFAEWKTACARTPRAAFRMAEIEKIVQTEQSLPPSSRQPLKTWQTIHRLLMERN